MVVTVLLCGCSAKQGLEATKEWEESQQVSDVQSKETLNVNEEIRHSLVQIEAGEVGGSGVIYKITEENMIIVTAGHVLEQAEDNVTVTFFNGATVESNTYQCSLTSEVAFIELHLSDISQDNLRYYRAVSVDKQKYDALTEGAKMKMPGGELEGQENIVYGTLLYPWIYVEDFEQYMMLVQGETVAGMSGGGLFDEENHYVGILCGVNEAGQTAAVPLNIIFAEYAQKYE